MNFLRMLWWVHIPALCMMSAQSIALLWFLIFLNQRFILIFLKPQNLADSPLNNQVFLRGHFLILFHHEVAEIFDDFSRRHHLIWPNNNLFYFLILIFKF